MSGRWAHEKRYRPRVACNKLRRWNRVRTIHRSHVSVVPKQSESHMLKTAHVHHPLQGPSKNNMERRFEVALGSTTFSDDIKIAVAIVDHQRSMLFAKDAAADGTGTSTHSVSYHGAVYTHKLSRNL